MKLIYDHFMCSGIADPGEKKAFLERGRSSFESQRKHLTWCTIKDQIIQITAIISQGINDLATETYLSKVKDNYNNK